MKAILVFYLMILLLAGCSAQKKPAGNETSESVFIRSHAPHVSLSTLIKVDSAYASGSGTQVILYAVDSLEVGYDQLYVVLVDSATHERVTHAHVQFRPLMFMPMMQHQSPKEDPSGSNATDGMFVGAVIFTMETRPAMDWSLVVTVNRDEPTRSGQAKFNLKIKPSKYLEEVLTDDNNVLLVSLVKPKQFSQGTNDVELLVSRLEDLQPDTMLAIELVFEVAGQTNGRAKINLTHAGNGHYMGRMDGVQPGERVLNFILMREGKAIGKTSFKVSAR